MTSGARFLINAIVVGIGILLPICTCLFAWFKGGKAERHGATLFFTAGMGTLTFEMLTHQSTPVIAELMLDSAVAIGFLALAIRYNNLWVGAAMMVKGLQLAVHATHLTDEADPMFAGFNLYAAGLNLISLVLCLILIGGTVASIRRRMADRKATEQPPLVLTPRAFSRRLSESRAGRPDAATGHSGLDRLRPLG